MFQVISAFVALLLVLVFELFIGIKFIRWLNNALKARKLWWSLIIWSYLAGLMYIILGVVYLLLLIKTVQTKSYYLLFDAVGITILLVSFILGIIILSQSFKLQIIGKK